MEDSINEVLYGRWELKFIQVTMELHAHRVSWHYQTLLIVHRRADIVSLVASCSLNQIGDMSRSEHAALKNFVEKHGQSVLDIVYDLNKIVLQCAKEEAEQMESNGHQAMADAESSAKATVGKDNELPLDIPIVDAIGDIDDEWEDEDERLLKGHIPHFLPRPLPRDGSGNLFMMIVHTNGIHSLPIV